jgi:hypothetical protein
MKKAIRVLWGMSLLSIVAGMATCYFGVRYAISQIPAEQRARMGDTDWVGVEWITRSLLLDLVALIFAFAAIVVWLIHRYLKRRDEKLRPDLPSTQTS